MYDTIDYGQMPPLERIRSLEPSLSKTLKKIAAYILDNHDKAIFLTSSKMARECDVSESSVIRFSTTMGYSGYTEMQNALQDVLKNQLSIQKRLDMFSIKDNDSIIDVVFQKGIEGIQRTLLSLDRDGFNKAVELLATSKRVFLFGSRSSYSLLHFFGLELCWIRDNVFTINVQAPEFDSISQLKKGDVFLAVSMPRYLKATTRAAALANEQGIPVIAITDRVTSPLYKYATIPLLVDNEIFSYSDNLVPIVCVLTAMLNAVGIALKPKSNKVLARNEKTWDWFDLYFR